VVATSESVDTCLHPPEVRENLRAAANQAPALAARHCAHSIGGDNCDWYHASWPVLRALGVINSPGSDDDFLLRAIGSELNTGAKRVLVSGAADAGMLARVTSCMTPGSTVEVTVLDRCRTPLELSRRHAEEIGLSIETIQADILSFESAQSFDLICTHSFLAFFDARDRQRLVARWKALLRPGGCVVTAQRVRPGEKAELTRFPPDEIQRLAAEAEHRARIDGEDIVGVDAARRLALDYGTKHQAHLIASPDDIERLFLDEGFVLEEFLPTDAARRLLDRPGAPASAGSCRWRILARNPDSSR
jgi:SAM-dependent methyltransferase